MFVETSISAIYKAAGMDPAAECPIEDRLAIQEVLLDTLTKQYTLARNTGNSLFITDRTPIDLASYMLADVGRQTAADRPVLAEHLVNYTRRCMEVTGEFFSVIVQVQPAIAAQNTPGKAAPCPAYMDHLNMVQMGLMADERCRVRGYAIPRSVKDLDARLGALKKAVEGALTAHRVLVKSATFH